MSTLTATQLQQQYIAYFGRPGDPAGIKYWLSSSSGISSAREFADKIYAQDEYKTSTVGGKSTEQQVNQLYKNLFGRSADAAGLLYWTNEIEQGNLQLSNVAFDLIFAASNPVAGNSDQAALDALALSNKVDAAEAFTAAVEADTDAILAYQPESTSPWVSGAAFSSAVSFITTATDTNATTDADVTAEITSIKSVNTTTTGSSFTLTDSNNQTTGGADNFTGTSSDDTFLASASNSYDNGDVIDGGAGTDTLTARYAVSAAKTVLGSVTNVETINVDLDDGDSGNAHILTVGVDGFTNLKHVVSKDGDSDASNQDSTVFNNIAAGVEAGITNGDADHDVDFVYKTTTSTTDTATLNLNAAKADEVTIAGIETLTVDGESGKSTIDTMVTAAATKYIMTGSGEVILTDIGDAVKTIDGSASTGGFTVGGLGAVDATVTGGTGNDTVNMGTTLTTADTITLGEGTDRVVVGEAHTAALSKITGVEELELEVANATAGIEVSGKAISSVTKFVVDVTANANGDDVELTFSNLDDGDSISIVNASSDTTAVDDGTYITGTLTNDTAADDITVSLEGLDVVSANATDDKGMGVITLASHETVNLVSNNNSTNSITTNGLEGLSISAGTSLNITGAAELDIDALTNTTKLTSIDASALTGKLTLDGIDSSKLVFKAATKDTVISMAGLNNDDHLVGGAGTKDYVTATGVTGLTATTGKLNIQDFETVELNVTAANTLDLSLLTGVTKVSLSGGTPGNQTITGLPAGLQVGIGDAGADLGNGDDVDITLADETGASDTLTLKVNNSLNNDTNFDLLTDSTIENVVLDLTNLDSTDSSIGDVSVTMAAAKAAKVTVSGGQAGASLDLQTLSTTTLELDATGLKADYIVNFGATDSGVTVNSAAFQTNTDVDLTAKNDTITIASTGGVSVNSDGLGGTDTMNLTVKAGFVDTASIDNYENLNITVNAGDDIQIGATSTASTRADAIAEATKIVLDGGNELSTFEVGDMSASASDSIDASVDIDASAFQGNIFLQYAADKFTATTDVDAGALATDTIYALFDTTALDMEVPTTGVETIIASLNSGNDNATDTYTFDVDGATGLKTLAMITSAQNDQTMVVDDYVDTVTVQIGAEPNTAGASTVVGAQNNSSVDINLKSSAGTADVVNVKLVDTEDQTGTDTFDIDAAGVETLNLSVSDDAESHRISLAGVTATTGSKVAINVTGGVSGDGIIIADVASTNNVIDASAYKGSVTITDRGSSAMTITGGSDGDDLRMEHASDVMDGGLGTDTLSLAKRLVLGGINVDLNSTTDQVGTFNGSTNAAIQKGFENINLAGITGTFGAEITARDKGSTIRGTINRDVITLGTDTTVDDTVALVGNDTNVESDIVTNFTKGASNDIIAFDLSELETAGRVFSGVTLDIVELNDASSLTAGVTMSNTTVTANNTAAGANAEIILLNAGTYADADAAVDAMEAGGSYTLNHAANIEANDAFLFAYESDDSTAKVRIAIAYFAAADDETAGADNIATGALDGVDLLELDDISEVTDLVDTNFSIVA